MISLIVPTYERPSLLSNLLSSLDDVNNDFELIIVDDGNSTEVEEIVSTYTFGKYIEGEGKGAMYARQKGIEHINGEVVGFLEDDMTVEPTFLSPIIRLFNDGEDIVQCRLIQEDKPVQRYPKSVYRWNFRHMVNFNAEESAYIDICQESGLFISKDVLSKCPLLDPKLAGDYGSSINFSMKSRKEGYDIFYTPSSRIYHHKAKFGGNVEIKNKQRGRSKDRHCTAFHQEFYHNMTYIHSMYFKSLLLPSIIYHFARVLSISVKYNQIQCLSICIRGMVTGLYRGLKGAEE